MERNEKTIRRFRLWGVDILIFITVGSQLTFDRLLKAVDKEIEAGNIKDQVIVQGGKTKFKSKNMKIIKFLELDEFDRYIKDADLIISHGGVGSIIDALKYNKTVIATPRLKKYKEALNDHQIQIIENFGIEGYIIPLLDLTELNLAIEKVKTFKPKKYKSNTSNMVKLIEDFIDKED